MATIRTAIAKALPPPTWTTHDLREKAQIQKLWAAIEEDTGHPLLIHFLARLIDVANVPARDPVAFARAVQLYSARRIKFFRERPERFQSAVRTIAWGIGDCDDKSRFIGASLRSFRIPTRLKILHLTLPSGQQMGHVYPLAWLPFPGTASQWVALESVREYPLGYDPEQRARERGFKVRATVIGDEGEDQLHV